MGSALSTADCIRQALGLAGEVDNGQSQYHANCVTWINQIHKDILSGSSVFNIDVGQPFAWARSETPKTLILQPAYIAGGVNLTNGSTAGLFTTPPDASLGSFVDRFIKSPLSADYYKITAHTAGAGAFTLDAEWTKDSVLGGSFKAIPLIYDLGANILRLVEPINLYRPTGTNGQNDGQCFGIHINEMRRNFPLARLICSIPERFATIFSSDEKFKIQFSSYVIEKTKVDLDWVPIPALLEDSTDSYPIVPEHKREVMVYGLASRICQEKNDWEAFGSFAKQAGAILASMMVESVRTAQSTAKSRGQLTPRGDLVYRNRYGRR